MIILGMQFEHASAEQYLTVLIDFEKYRHESIVRSRLTDGISTIRSISKACADSENEEYRMCGKKCVLNCRYDATVAPFLISKKQCDTNKCVEGCFCKENFVRYNNKCVPIDECPARRNKAVEFVTEANALDNGDAPQMNMQISIQNSTQNSNQDELDKNANNPKIFGFLNRPGCGFLGCFSMQQQYGASEERKDGEDSGKHPFLLLISFICHQFICLCLSIDSRG